MKRWIFLTTLSIFVWSAAFSSEAQWERVSAGIPASEKINFVERDGSSGLLYAGTDKGLYSSPSEGVEWTRVDLGAGGVSARRIAFPEGGICLATAAGLYLSADRKNWERVAGKKGLIGVAAGEAGSVLTWSDDELYVFDENGFERSGPAFLDGSIEDVAFRDSIVYLGAGGKLYYSGDGCITWNRFRLVDGAAEEAVDGEEEEEEGSPSLIRKIDVSGPRGAAIATNNGIFLADPLLGTLERFDTAGLPASEVSFALDAGGCIIATAGGRVFALYEQRGAWFSLFESAACGRITWLKITNDNIGETRLYVSSEKGIFAGKFEFSPEVEQVFELKSADLTVGEPGIREVQEMAIEYAEVSPEKIKSWRNGARWKALLPKLSLNYGESYDDNVELYKSSTAYYVASGPREKGNDWDVDLTWDLSDLIWNDAQTSIDVRSKLMVQLREDLLEEVTRLYFERKRLLSEMGNIRENREKELMDKRLRVQELTAYIDALTGGGFSEAMKSQ